MIKGNIYTDKNTGIEYRIDDFLEVTKYYTSYYLSNGQILVAYGNGTFEIKY